MKTAIDHRLVRQTVIKHSFKVKRVSHWTNAIVIIFLNDPVTLQRILKSC